VGPWAGVAIILLLGALIAVVIMLSRSPSKEGPVRAEHATTTSAPSTTATAPPKGEAVVESTTAASRQPVTIAAVGDLSLGSTPSLPPSPATYLDGVASALAAPTLFGNLEGTLTASTASKCVTPSASCFAFRAPPSYAPLLRQNGFTVLNSANNHSHDFGAQGVSDTSAALKAANIAQTGLPGQVAVVDQGGTRIAFVGFAPYTSTSSMLQLEAARRLVQQAKGEADVVVVYMHAGAEGSGAAHVTGQEETYLGEDRGNAKAFAHAAIDAGANLVIASGPHVLRGMEFYKGDLIAYSLANFAGYHNFSISGDLSLSGVLRVTLDGSGKWQSGQFVSTLLDGDGHPTVDPKGAAAHFVAGVSTTDFGPAAAKFAADGTITPPA
jgi:hypothetical protein